MGWSHPDEDTRADHYRDERKHDTPAHRFDKPTTTALEIAVLVQAISITQAAELIEQYGNTRAAEGRLEGVGQLDKRLSVALESPLTPPAYGGE
jgi:hypothetical protein